MTSARLFITGGTGFIGQALCEALAEHYQITVLTRYPERSHSALPAAVKRVSQVPVSFTEFDAVINLAGAPIADRRWTDARKQLLLDSRFTLTEALVKAMGNGAPRVFISGSAIGYYGAQRAELTLTEETPFDSNDFAHRLCQGWEQRALAATPMTRVCLLRTGLVLGHGGALKKMLPAFRLGLGGQIGSGKQIMSWISLADMVSAIIFLLDNDQLSGAFNCTAPHPVSNRAFTDTLGQVLQRPTWLTVPAWAIKLLLGEGATLLLDGQSVLPQRLTEAGFSFLAPTLEQALGRILAAN